MRNKASLTSSTYELEWLREFVVRRPWFSESPLLNQGEYEELKARRFLTISPTRLEYLKGFIDGWKSRKADVGASVELG
jgi:hypothetical protein